MCFDLDSRPPIAPLAGAAIEHRDLELTANDGNRFAAFAAMASRPSGTSSSAGSVAIVILPDVRGLHPFYEELALRFAEEGIDAVAMDYFGRTAGVGKRADGFDHMAHVPRTTWAGIQADAVAAAGWLRSERGASDVFTIGFCFGGRQSFLCATVAELAASGVIGFYGPPAGPGRNDSPAPVDVADRFRCPVLGIFGGTDQGIPPQAIAGFDEALSRAGVEHELINVPGAPHSFFDRKQEEFADASADAWRRVLRFIRERAGAAERRKSNAGR
jgi:carboxymethylenebutenolidase